MTTTAVAAMVALVTYITDAWGTRIEIIEHAPLQPTQ